MKTTCLRCHYYKVADVESGYCKVLVKETGDREAARPRVAADHCCEKWEDCGQNYYIRLGWIKARIEAENAGAGQ